MRPRRERTGLIGTTAATVESFARWGLDVETDTRAEPAFQGPPYTVTVKQPDLGCSEQPKLTECIRAAQEAWRRLSSGHRSFRRRIGS